MGRDRQLLEHTGYAVAIVRERPGFVQATVSRGHDLLLIEWVHDSAYRFFPLVEHEELGLTLHPFDLATNKVLAFIGRLKVRDWIEVIACDERLQPLGYLAWAACGKDPGFSPLGVIDDARRSSHYSSDEIASLAFDGPPPDPADLSRRWSRALDTAQALIGQLPAADDVATRDAVRITLRRPSATDFGCFVQPLRTRPGPHRHLDISISTSLHLYIPMS